MKRRTIRRGLLSVIMLLCLMAVPASAAGSFSITRRITSAPSTVKKNKLATYAMSMTYNSSLWDKIPIPTSCQLGIELSSNVFNKVYFRSGSASMSFVRTTGSVTGKPVYQCYRSYRITGKATKSFRVQAKAVSKAKRTGRVSMGTGKVRAIRINENNYVFTVRTK
ncbi:MAG: hypothetical protein IJI24_08695 [Lachnospiraceae bacterium]|nr:hypothetical protein [Lachnospiraceae bacterium]